MNMKYWWIALIILFPILLLFGGVIGCNLTKTKMKKCDAAKLNTSTKDGMNMTEMNGGGANSNATANRSINYTETTCDGDDC